MSTWTDDDLARIGGAEELRIASQRPDGTLRPYVTIWVVRAGDDLYVRSAHGAGNPWFRRATSAGVGTRPGGRGAPRRQLRRRRSCCPGRHRSGLPRQVRPVRTCHRRSGLTVDAELERVVEAYRAKYGWPLTVRDGELHAPFAAPAAGPPPYQAYAVTPEVIFGMGTDEALAPRSTRWRFSPGQDRLSVSRRSSGRRCR
jgi:Uncharacterized protein conserved in bacteria (DUF2255)